MIAWEEFRANHSSEPFLFGFIAASYVPEVLKKCSVGLRLYWEMGSHWEVKISEGFFFPFLQSVWKGKGSNSGMMFQKVTFVITHCKCYSPSTKHSIKLKSSEKYPAPLQQLHLASESLGFLGSQQIPAGDLHAVAAVPPVPVPWEPGCHKRFPFLGLILTFPKIVVTKQGSGFLCWQSS